MKQKASWEIPNPISTIEVESDESTHILVRRYGNPNAQVRLLLSHGNGLAIDLYYPFWSLLASEFDLMVYDLRNHGWNQVGQRKHHNIPNLIQDHDRILDAVEREYGGKPTVGVYHSLSALVGLLSDTQMYSALVLFDPPICKPTANEAEFDAAAERTARRTRKRHALFRSEEEFSDMLGYLPGFSRVQPGVTDLIAKTTLRRRVDNSGYELRCPSDYEAQIVDYVRSFAPLLDLAELPCPTKVVGADPTMPYSYLPSFNLQHVLAVDYDFVPETTHFLQLENPAACVAILREFLANNSRKQHQPLPDTRNTQS